MFTTSSTKKKLWCWTRQLSLLCFSIITGLIVFVYLIPLPKFMFPCRNSRLVSEYYYSPKSYINVIMDIFFVSMYLLLPWMIWNWKRITHLPTQLGITALTTGVLTFGFMMYFQSFPPTRQFFSRWFHQVGYFAIFYDIVLLCGIVTIYHYLFSYVD